MSNEWILIQDLRYITCILERSGVIIFTTIEEIEIVSLTAVHIINLKKQDQLIYFRLHLSTDIPFKSNHTM